MSKYPARGWRVTGTAEGVPDVVKLVGPQERSATFGDADLVDDTLYTFTVEKLTALGIRAPIGPLPPPKGINLIFPPGAPTAVSFSSTSGVVVITPPLSTGGAPITKYVITVLDDSTNAVIATYDTTTPEGTTIAVPEVAARISAVAVNIKGAGLASPEASHIPLPTFIDNFDRADENPILAPWNVVVTGATRHILSASNLLHQSAVSWTVHDSGYKDFDQTAEFDLTGVPDGYTWAMIGNSNTSGTERFGAFVGPASIQIIKRVAGTQTTMVTIGIGHANADYVKIRFKRSDMFLSVWLNDTLQYSGVPGGMVDLTATNHGVWTTFTNAKVTSYRNTPDNTTSL